MNDQQLLRYSRQIMLEGFDYEGQQKLLNATVLIVGLGGLGCPAALYLASAGVGTLLLADFDRVELSNLQRQIAHAEDSIDLNKARSAAAQIRRLNSACELRCLEHKLEGEHLQRAVAGADMVLDCSDNFATRFELNRVCQQLQKPLVSGAAIRSEGQIIVFDPRQPLSPCYRCLYSDELSGNNLSCSDSGVLAPLVGVIGAMQALEAIKLLAGFGDSLVGRLLVFDAAFMDWRKLTVNKNPDCPVCGP